LERVGPEGNNLYSIFVFSEEDAWVTNYCSSYHWDGNDWTYYRFSSGGVGVNTCAGNSTWGTSSSDMYFVGISGSIVHYDGKGFEKMESLPGQGVTDIGLTDIWGLDQDHVWIGGDVHGGSSPWGSVLLSLKSNSWEKLYEYHVPEDGYDVISMKSIWTDNTDTIYAGGYSGNWAFSIQDSALIDLEEVGMWVKEKIRGVNRNDIFSVGQGSEVMHFNGRTWYIYPELKSLGNGTVMWKGLSVIKDFVVIVGVDNSAEFGSYPLLVVRGYR
jgi:hypothetical protein